ncbi:MAG: pyridoxal phosphate-dependent decarboxylase family protein [Rectinemataceae bacterium]
MQRKNGTDAPSELGLDPENWDEVARLGKRMVDDMVAYLRSLPEKPVFTPVPEAVKEGFETPAPREGSPAEAVYEDFLASVLPYAKGNNHPRFWGWVEGTGTAMGMLAGFLANAMNANAAFGDQSAVYVELQVLNWLKEILGFPMAAEGLLLSGGSMANLVALAAARDSRGDTEIGAKGVDPGRRALRLYASIEAHNSVDRAVRLLGLGLDALVKVPVREDFRIDVEALRAAIAADREAGFAPFCILGSLGTVNTGAIDPLDELADLAAQEGLWFHVDGAIGAAALPLPGFEKLRESVARADSLAFDLHKWFYVQYEAGCVLVRDRRALEAPFKQDAAYLVSHERGVSAGPVAFADRGPELSRSFRALKVWMQFKEAGMKKHAALAAQNIGQARYLAGLVEASPRLELMAPVSLNIVCFRYNPGGLSDEKLDRINREILMTLQAKGIAVPSYTVLHGKYVMRAAITNHRSRRADFEALAAEAARIGDSIR